MKEMPIFTRTFDLIAWLLPVTNSFPQAHRHTATKRLLDTAFNLRECLEIANLRRGEERLGMLHRANDELTLLRFYLRLAAQWHWLSSGQYQHITQITAEIGKLLGGWQKSG